MIGHEHVERRFDRYDYTAGYNRVINMRQFGGAAIAASTAREAPFLPAGTLRPDLTYEDRLTERIGDVEFDFRHCLGETDDHTWTWIPQHG